MTVVININSQSLIQAVRENKNVSFEGYEWQRFFNEFSHLKNLSDQDLIANGVDYLKDGQNFIEVNYI